MKFEIKRGPKKKKKKRKNLCFISWKVYFFSFHFVITPFHLHFKDDF